MTAEEVLEKRLLNIHSEAFSDMKIDDEGIFNEIIKAMEDYAQYKVNELNKSDVIKSVGENECCGRCAELE